MPNFCAPRAKIQIDARAKLPASRQIPPAVGVDSNGDLWAQPPENRFDAVDVHLRGAIAAGDKTAARNALKAHLDAALRAFLCGLGAK